jgi:hypothetical protein
MKESELSIQDYHVPIKPPWKDRPKEAIKLLAVFVFLTWAYVDKIIYLCNSFDTHASFPREGGSCAKRRQ